MKKKLVLIILIISNSLISQNKIISNDGQKIDYITYSTKKGKIYYFENKDSITEKTIKIKDVILIENSDDTITNKQLLKNSFEKNHNFMLGLGVGNSFGGIGIQLQWHNAVPFHAASHIAIGKTSETLIFNVGYKIYPYKIFYLDLDIGSKGWEEEVIPQSNGASYYSGTTESKALFGSSLMAGIDVTGGKKNSFGFNLGIGYTKHFNSDTPPSAIAFSAGILYRMSKWKK